MKTPKDLKEIIESLASAVVEVMTYNPDDIPDLYDTAHEVVDGCEDVIYTFKAKEIVDALNDEELAEAEDYLRDMGAEHEGLYQYYTQLAYAFLLPRVTEEASNMLESGE